MFNGVWQYKKLEYQKLNTGYNVCYFVIRVDKLQDSHQFSLKRCLLYRLILFTTSQHYLNKI